MKKTKASKTGVSISSPQSFAVSLI